MRSRLLRCLALTTVLTASLLALAGCGGTVVGVVRTGAPRPAREPACALTLETIDPAERPPGARFGAGGEYEQVGVVTLGTTLGTDPMSEDVLREVRPRACAMGGEVIALMSTVSSRRGYGQTDIAFSVWAHRVARPTAPGTSCSSRHATASLNPSHSIASTAVPTLIPSTWPSRR